MFWNDNYKNESWCGRYQKKRNEVFQKADFYRWKIGHCVEGAICENSGEASIIFKFIPLKLFMTDKVSAFFLNELYIPSANQKLEKY